MECAGFLASLGYDVTVAARSILLREFDRQCAEKLGVILSDYGAKVMTHTYIKSIVKQSDGRLLVTFDINKSSTSSMSATSATATSTTTVAASATTTHLRSASVTEPLTDIFDTVLFATGRLPDFQYLNLPAAGVTVSPVSGKIPVVQEVTNVGHIYAVGDVCEGKQELTPVAIHAGQLLGTRRLHIQLICIYMYIHIVYIFTCIYILFIYLHIYTYCSYIYIYIHIVYIFTCIYILFV
jgi:thioredoxin reductase (NADPH)